MSTFVLVHGAWQSSGTWDLLAPLLEEHGHRVITPTLRGLGADQSHLTSEVTLLQHVEDVSAELASLADKAVLVGHSYAGMIITELGMHPDVKALVYVAAFQPDVGETAGELAGKMPAASKAVAPVGDNFLAVNAETFPQDFAADAPKSLAHFMAISQVPIAADIFAAKVTVAAWKEKPSYAVIPKQDRMLNPDLERFMAKRAKSQTIELPGSHAIFISHAREVAALIEKAAKAAK